MQDSEVQDSNKAPTLTVVLSNYNHAQFLPRAFESITSQTLQPDEILVLDDASTDNSIEIIESYAAKHAAVRLIRGETNQGVIKAYRRLFEAAAGTYIHPLAADDERDPRFFERAMAMATKYPDAGLVFGCMDIIDEEGNVEGRASAKSWTAPVYASPDQFVSEYLLIEKPSHSLVGATVFRREPFLEVGCYQAELGSWGDTFAFNAVGLKHGVCFVPETFAIWHKQRASYSQQTISNPVNTLKMIEQAVELMRSARYRDCFPEAFVRDWSKRYRRQVALEYWRGDNSNELPKDASRWRRICNRIPRTPRALSLLWSSARSLDDKS